ncbi:MAG: GNAT family N-acetyltransferase, partial [Candidatus Omnitrophica bacterium]|nr:GNAT family N-acetyltransferase [Candidatus Omnitrophota bacterium]
MMNIYKNCRTWTRMISLGVVFLFLINQHSFAFGQISRAENASTLSPVSRIKPVITLEERNGRIILLENDEEKKRFTSSFQRDAGFIYLSTLITQVLNRFGPATSAEVVKNLIRDHLSHVDMGPFRWQKLYKEGEVFCLPYVREDGQKQLLRFSFARGEKASFPDTVMLKFDDRTRSLLEDPLIGNKRDLRFDLYTDLPDERKNSELFELIRKMNDDFGTRSLQTDASFKMALDVIWGRPDHGQIKNAMIASDREGRPVGIYCFSVSSDPAEPIAWADGIYVNESDRGRGAGRTLREVLLDHLKSSGVKEFRIGDTENDHPGVRLGGAAQAITRSFVERHHDAVIHIRFYPDGSIWEVSVDLEQVEPLYKYRTGDGDMPAVMMAKSDLYDWLQYIPTHEKEHHRVINSAWEQIWNEEYDLPGDDDIVRDIRDRLGPDDENIPLHVQCPPQKKLYDRIYQLDRSFREREGKRLFPPREDFRLLTHAGTWREADGAPRSFNLLIPREELDFIRWLKKNEDAAYSDWLDHEATHLMDRSMKKKGRELSESVISDLYPVRRLVRVYADYQAEKALAGFDMGAYLEKLDAPALQGHYFPGFMLFEDRVDSIIHDMVRTGAPARHQMYLKLLGDLAADFAYEPGKGVRGPSSRALYVIQAASERGYFTVTPDLRAMSWQGRYQPGMYQGEHLKLKADAREAALKELALFYRRITAEALKAFSRRPEKVASCLDLEFIYPAFYFGILDVVRADSENYSEDVEVRRAAAGTLADLIRTRTLYLSAIKGMEKATGSVLFAGGAGGEMAIRENNRMIVDSIGRVVLGEDPMEKDLRVRNVLLKVLSEHVDRGMYDSLVLVESLFETCGDTEESDYNPLKGAITAHLVRAVLRNGEASSIKYLRRLARKKRSHTSAVIRLALEGEEAGKKSGKGGAGLYGLAFPGVVLAYSAGEDLYPVIDAILGVSLLVGVPLLLYHALRLGAAVMITMRPRHRVIAELALGGV